MESWAALFERGDDYDATVERIRDALAKRRTDE
jgi:hypothetical protein